jgi:hypothetical protein
MTRQDSSGITDTPKDLNNTSSDDDGIVQFPPISNPATGEWIQFIPAPENSNDDVVRFHWRSMPGGMITEHIHPHQSFGRRLMSASVRPSSYAFPIRTSAMLRHLSSSM